MQCNSLEPGVRSVERRLKERLTGAAVLILLAVIFIPMILDTSVQDEIRITETNIPPRPDTTLRTLVIPDEPPPVNATVAPVIPIEEPANDAAVTSDETYAEDATTVPVTEDAPVTTTSVMPPSVPAAKPAEQAIADEPSASGLSAWIIQLGSFSSQANATNLVQQLQNEGYPAFLEELNTGTGIAWRVRVGPEVRRVDAEAMLERLSTNMKLEGIILRYP